MSHPFAYRLLAASLFGLAACTAAAEGGKEAYGAPNDPADETYRNPFTNQGDGRIQVFCAEDELLVITPLATGVAEATCVPAS